MKTTQTRAERLAAARATYGDNHWWESTDPLVLAYHQIHEPVLCMDWSVFHAAVEEVVEHPVWTHQFVTDHVELENEIDQRWAQREVG